MFVLEMILFFASRSLFQTTSHEHRIGWRSIYSIIADQKKVCLAAKDAFWTLTNIKPLQSILKKSMHTPTYTLTHTLSNTLSRGTRLSQPVSLGPNTLYIILQTTSSLTMLVANCFNLLNPSPLVLSRLQFHPISEEHSGTLFFFPPSLPFFECPFAFSLTEVQLILPKTCAFP